MKTPHRLLTLAAGLLLACTVATAAQKNNRLYKWTDKDGVVHYGDTVPPEYASQAREELNGQGVTLREVPRQLSPAEAEAARQAAAEETRRRQRDSFLLNSYTRVADIEQLRDERIALIDSQMELARASIGGIDQRLNSAQDRLRKFRPYSSSANARRVPDDLAREVVRTMSERRSMVTQLQRYEEDKVTQKASFDADIARYLELTSRN